MSYTCLSLSLSSSDVGISIGSPATGDFQKDRRL